MFFRLKRTIKLSIKSIWMHRLRSILTTLGIIFGVSSVIAMLAIGEGASRRTQEQITRLGNSNIIIRTVKPPEDKKSTTQTDTLKEYGLTYNDAEIFHQSVPGIEVIVPIRRLFQQAWYRNKTLNIEIMGVVPWYTDTTPAKIVEGRFLTSTDTTYKLGVCAVDQQVVEKLFGFDEPINQHIKIGREYYKVVGAVTNYNSSIDNDTLNTQPAGRSNSANSGNIYIPLTTVKERFGEISVQLSGTDGRSIEKVELQEIIIKVRSTDEVLPAAEALKNLLARFHKKNDYEIIVPLELLRQTAERKRIYNIVLGSIAAISLLVGGIGIMNIMLASVSERTREIGIRRALGAKKRDIVVQFLSETLMLTLVGGLLGIALGSAIPYFVSRFSSMPTVVTAPALILSFGISAMVGITFGIYPAWRAANMDPIESLRHE
jgi:putative ABC transport system permease protein